MEWMFKLVGAENFVIGKQKVNCSIIIQAADGFTYEYSLEVAGKPLEKFTECRSKIQNTWCLPVDGVMTRVVLGKLKGNHYSIQNILVCYMIGKTIV